MMIMMMMIVRTDPFRICFQSLNAKTKQNRETLSYFSTKTVWSLCHLISTRNNHILVHNHPTVL